MSDATQELKLAFAAWAKEKFDEIRATGVAVKHMTVDKIVEEFDREQAVRKDLESKAKD